MYRQVNGVDHKACAETEAQRLVQDYFIFCLFSLGMQAVAFTVFAMRGYQDADDIEDAVERVIDLFIAAWPSIGTGPAADLKSSLFKQVYTA